MDVETIDDVLQTTVLPETAERALRDGAREDALTVLMAPGFGSRSPKVGRMVEVQKAFSERGVDVSVASFLYRSHSSDRMRGFSSDANDFSAVVDSLVERGHDHLLLVGVCYGAFVISQYLARTKGPSFQGSVSPVEMAIMLEPYLGLETLRKPLRKTANLLSRFVHHGLSSFPIGRRFDGRKSYLDVGELLEVSNAQIEMDCCETPMLVIYGGAHSFFDPSYAKRFFNGCDAKFEKVDAKHLKKGFDSAYEFACEFIDSVRGRTPRPAYSGSAL